MFDNIKNKISAKIAEAEEKERERKRMEAEKIEQEKQRLLSLDEKELLVELIFSMKNIEKEQKILLEKIENLDATIWSRQ
ncbi:MAG: hypothetical protein V8R81_05195 [Clostridia bacterium]